MLIKRELIMPDIMSHILMGYEVLNKLPKDNIFKDAATDHSGLFNNGLQGPDPFFYSSSFPFSKQSYGELGNLMHKEKTGLFLLGLIDSLKNSKVCSEMKAACLCGLICHYCLDTICHPYIFYFSGFDYSGKHPEYSVCHKRFETILDMLLVKQKIKEPSRFIDRSHFLDTSDDKLCAYQDFSKEIMNTYEISISPSEYLKSLRHMQYALRLLHDPIGLKSPFFVLLDRLFHTHGIYSASIFDYKKIKAIDYANLSHEKWKHPVTGELSSDSFLDLFEAARANAIEKISAANDYLVGKSDKSLLINFFPDLDYDTGLADEAKMLYHKCIFE